MPDHSLPNSYADQINLGAEQIAGLPTWGEQIGWFSVTKLPERSRHPSYADEAWLEVKVRLREGWKAAGPNHVRLHFVDCDRAFKKAISVVRVQRGEQEAYKLERAQIYWDGLFRRVIGSALLIPSELGQPEFFEPEKAENLAVPE